MAADNFRNNDRMAGTAVTLADGTVAWAQRVVTGSVSGGTFTPASGAALSAADLRSQNSAFSSVNSGTTSVTLLAANSTRNGATIVNTDANTLYIDLTGGTASATRYSYALAQNGWLEVPFGIAGTITGVWAVDGTGAALVTEARP